MSEDVVLVCSYSKPTPINRRRRKHERATAREPQADGLLP